MLLVGTGVGGREHRAGRGSGLAGLVHTTWGHFDNLDMTLEAMTGVGQGCDAVKFVLLLGGVGGGEGRPGGKRQRPGDQGVGKDRCPARWRRWGLA